MAEDLERVPARVVPRDHRVVAERVRLPLRPVADLSQMRDASPWQRLRGFQIMVADDQVFLCARQLIEQLGQPVGLNQTGFIGEV